jgi:hypothetical protein
MKHRSLLLSQVFARQDIPAKNFPPQETYHILPLPARLALMPPAAKNPFINTLQNTLKKQSFTAWCLTWPMNKPYWAAGAWSMPAF